MHLARCIIGSPAKRYGESILMSTSGQVIETVFSADASIRTFRANADLFGDSTISSSSYDWILLRERENLQKELTTAGLVEFECYIIDRRCICVKITPDGNGSRWSSRAEGLILEVLTHRISHMRREFNSGNTVLRDIQGKVLIAPR
jgi:hypothetical protein